MVKQELNLKQKYNLKQNLKSNKNYLKSEVSTTIRVKQIKMHYYNSYISKIQSGRTFAYSEIAIKLIFKFVQFFLLSFLFPPLSRSTYVPTATQIKSFSYFLMILKIRNMYFLMVKYFMLPVISLYKDFGSPYKNEIQLNLCNIFSVLIFNGFCFFA